MKHTTSNQHEQEKAGTLSVPAKKVGLMLESNSDSAIYRNCTRLLQSTAFCTSEVNLQNSTESAVNLAMTSQQLMSPGIRQSTRSFHVSPRCCPVKNKKKPTFQILVSQILPKSVIQWVE